MSDEKRGRDPRWEAIDRALGGRFRDGAECPEYVFDLLQLARAEAAGQPLPDTADFLREHFHVCPVCRRIYRSALAAARESSEVALPEREDLPALEPTMATALGDGALATVPSSLHHWRIPVRPDQATICPGELLNSDATALVRIYWTDQRLQINPTGFLLPDPSERLELVWSSADHMPLGRAELSGGQERVSEVRSPPRPPQSRDRLQLRRLDENDKVVLEVEVEFS